MANPKTDRASRIRLAKWVKYYRQLYPTTDAMAADGIGLKAPTLTNIINGKRLPGLDVLTKLRGRFKRSADDYLDWDPEQLMGANGAGLRAAEPAPPRGASPSAQPGKHRAGAK